jgi:hypothetical protein
MNTYKKKYNYVLKRAKALKECSLSPRIKDWVDSVFPELKESEDEMIRKWLIAQLELKSDVHNPRDLELMYLKSIAWLEKQGEKFIPEDINEAALQYVDTCAVDGEITHDNVTEPYWNNHSMMSAYKAGWLEKQAQKPKWSKEDEENFNDIDILLFEDKNISKEKYWKMIDWFRSLKQRMEK